MKNLIRTLVFILAGVPALADQPVPAFLGDWRGGWVNPEGSYHKRSPQLTAQITGLGDDQYRVVFREEFQRRADIIFEAEGSYEDGAIDIETDTFQCRVTDASITGAGVYKSDEPTKFALTKFIHESPTMGRVPPEGAVVLFDGSSLDAWQHVDGGTGKSRDATWKIVDGAMETLPVKLDKSAGGDLQTRDSFASCELHIEFFLPYEPDNRGQGRANSGVFIQGIYEVQILDSYGLIGDWIECGALYKVAPPKVNRCAPPGEWQTYDITFHAPEYDAEGVLVKNAVMTVLHNGRLIHNQQELFEVTYFFTDVRLGEPPREPAPIILQDHGHPIRFRNVWLKPLD
ncbi:MAG: DUF1080 domain-containing protein [Puniceicoccaceae bacterium]